MNIFWRNHCFNEIQYLYHSYGRNDFDVYKTILQPYPISMDTEELYTAGVELLDDFRLWLYGLYFRDAISTDIKKYLKTGKAFFAIMFFSFLATILDTSNNKHTKYFNSYTLEFYIIYYRFAFYCEKLGFIHDWELDTILKNASYHDNIELNKEELSLESEYNKV